MTNKFTAGFAEALLCTVLLAPAFADAKEPGSHSSGHGSSHSRPHNPGGHTASGVARDSHGKIKRSATATHEFQKSHPCPSTGKTSGGCPGYVIDHIKPLKRGGADSPNNMQWQTTQAAKRKDATE